MCSRRQLKSTCLLGVSLASFDEAQLVARKVLLVRSLKRPRVDSGGLIKNHYRKAA